MQASFPPGKGKRAKKMGNGSDEADGGGTCSADVGCRWVTNSYACDARSTL